jgi:homoserine kinase
MKSATAFAPATVANVAVGFDLLGFAIEGIGDEATVSIIDRAGAVEIAGIAGINNLPQDPVKNTATAGLLELLKDQKVKLGFRVQLKKGIPLGSGMGGSAASAVAAAAAANVLLPRPLRPEELLKYILIGEAVASGSKHGDNVAPSLLGGLVLVSSVDPPRVTSISVPKGIHAAVVHPPLEIKTKEARAILKPELTLKTHIHQSALLGGFLAGCFKGDLDLIGRSLKDIVIEPQRARLVRGFPEVQHAALSAGALGCSISGAGPAIFALTPDRAKAEAAGKAMCAAFAAAGVSGARAWVSALPAPGARILDP